MKSPLAKARDEWLNSEEGKKCCEGTTAGEFLQNRLKRAFLAGAEFSNKRTKALEERREALEQLLVCYRGGKNPSEALHRKLYKTKRALKGGK